MIQMPEKESGGKMICVYNMRWLRWCLTCPRRVEKEMWKNMSETLLIYEDVRVGINI